MQILGIGTEIVECLRIGKMIEAHGELFLRRVFTEREIRSCQARRRALEHFAGHWAAKEAIVKALGAGGVASGCWTDLEVRDGEPGSKVRVRGAIRDLVRRRGVTEILLSMSHCRTYATAYVLVLGGAATITKPTIDFDDSP